MHSASIKSLTAIVLASLGGLAQAGDLPNGQYTAVFVHSGRCLDVAWAATTDGANIAQVTCNGNTAQAYNIQDMGNGYYRLLNANSGKAVDVSSASTADGANIQQWSDNGSGAQRFKITRAAGNEFTLTNQNSNKCVGVAGAGTGDGANVEQQSCTGASNQRIRFIPVGIKGAALPAGRYTLTSVNSGKCLDISGASTADGGNAQQWTCNGTGAQSFDLRPEGAYYIIANANSGKVLDVASASMANGANVQQWTQNSSLGQRFYFTDTGSGRYQVRARQSDFCLDVAGVSTADGGNVQQWGCGTGQANQQWTVTPVSASSGGTVPSDSWELVWSDEFNGPNIDASKWNFEVNGQGGGNNEQQYYTARADNAFIQDGKLVIQGKREHYCSTDGCREFTSARLNSNAKGDWLYGRFEARAKLPRGKGMWPAIWMLPTDWTYGSWPLSGEIDIMEAVNTDAGGGNTVYGSIHYGNAWPNNQHQTFQIDPSGSVADSFHTYAMEWDTKEIRMYVDGVKYGTFNNWFTAGGTFPAPFDKRFHWVLNLAMGGDWPGAVDAATALPARMEIDYVRVYRKK